MGNRRNFVKKIAGCLMLAATEKNKWPVLPHHEPRVRTDNPYAGVDWTGDKHIPSTSHIHITSQEMLDKACKTLKLKHIPISNYYPSAPCYPIGNIRKDQFRVKQDFGTMYSPGNGQPSKYLEGPIYWNKIIMDPETGWYEDLPETLQTKIPFTEGGRLFTRIPRNIIVSPNAEHHAFTNSPLHANALGSLYSSGSFDQRDQFKTRQHGYANGTKDTWENVFRKMLDQLLFPEGGGITINHPVWSKLDTNEVFRMLDFDPRVLGIEVFNDTCAIDFGDPTRGWSLKLWDSILSSGRKCLGFFVPDHSFGRGKNILLVKRFTEQECLEAYRKGAFYGALNGSGLRFVNITLANYTLRVETNKIATMRFITNKGEVLKMRNVSALEYKIPLDNTGNPAIHYVRVEANDDISEQIYSQPIRFW